jgi:hypothetical protein
MLEGILKNENVWYRICSTVTFLSRKNLKSRYTTLPKVEEVPLS